MLLVAAVGCSAPGLRVEASSELNTWLARAALDTSVRNAIVTQHTLYDYHFIRDAATLNDLGWRDVTVLAEHFRQYPGALNVRRGSASAALHQERVESVIAALNEAGVEADRVTVSDGLPGGEGMRSEHILVILQEPDPEVYRTSAVNTQPITQTGVQR